MLHAAMDSLSAVNPRSHPHQLTTQPSRTQQGRRITEHKTQLINTGFARDSSLITHSHTHALSLPPNPIYYL
jgi:hypothetical protein